MKRQYILNFTPNNCPGCGVSIHFKEYQVDDFHAGCSFSCKCGVQYQKVPFDVVTERLEDVLDKHMVGDL